MPSATTAAVGWSVVLLVAGGFYFISNQRKNKNRRSLPVKGPVKTAETRKDSKPKKNRKETRHTNPEPEARRNTKPHSVSSEEKSVLPTRQVRDDEVDNHEFARQLLNVKSGTIARPKSQTSTRPKSVKQGRAQEKQRIESSDSTTGNEADDESVLNPSSLNGLDANSPINSQGVSDMLEKTPTQSGILRVTAPLQAQPEKRKPAKKVEPVETKKQRQNRQKANAAKLLKAEEEQARKTKMEQQRRTAREAEGRAAKDGSAFMASMAPTSSAWNPSSTTNGNSIDAEKIQLLDTYEAPSHNIAANSERVYSESEEAGSSRQETSVLSEEEQVRFAIKETETWSVVKGKEKRNRANKAKDTVPSNSETKSFDNLVSDVSFNAADKVDNPAHVGNYSSNKGIKKFDEEDIVLEDSEWDVS